MTPSEDRASVVLQSGEEALLEFLANLEEQPGSALASAAHSKDMLGVVDMPGFARFCGLPPERREFFESLAYVRVTPETLGKFRDDFKRECKVRLLRRSNRDWVLVRLPEVGETDGPDERLGVLSGNGIRLTIGSTRHPNDAPAAGKVS